jgi:hypothetical protein
MAAIRATTRIKASFATTPASGSFRCAGEKRCLRLCPLAQLLLIAPVEGHAYFSKSHCQAKFKRLAAAARIDVTALSDGGRKSDIGPSWPAARSLDGKLVML